MPLNNIYYSESREKTGEYLRLALALMVQNNTAPNPVNYAVWYEYVTGKNYNLKKMIDDSIGKGITLTPEILQEFYRNYIVDGDRITQREILSGIQELVEGISHHVGEAGGNFARRESNLQQCKKLIQKNLENSSLRKVVNAIIGETKGLIDSSANLEAQLSEANNEVKKLRVKLEQSKAEAQTDALTGLINRRGLESILSGNMKKTMESGTSMCIMMGDIDHFKRINDNYGHLVGDNVIRMFAATLTDLVKGRDKVVRYGGEEFLVILPETPIKGAVALAEKVRSFLEKMQWQKKGSGTNLGMITISIGVAQYRYNESMESFIKRSDDALYFSKESGRNKVSTDCGITGV